MMVFKCKMCGGDLEVQADGFVATCEYCGTKQTLPKVQDEEVGNLFNRANNLRRRCEFDKAERVYENILNRDDTQAEAHWGIVLCRYGIEYVEDPLTHKRIPTCHRTSYDAVATDVDYLAAIENAELNQRSIYEAEAKAIDQIQKNILRIVKDEQPFDVFLCYKETDENGKRTIDSTITNDIYYQLTAEGYKVFYAPITLEEKLGEEYEPYIFAALNSAKVMLVIGTKPEYFDAIWVKNEWSRFLKLMRADRSKLLIPCYKDMDAYDLPEEFAHLQAQDMGKIGFIIDIVRGIKKIITKTEPNPAPPTQSVIPPQPIVDAVPHEKEMPQHLHDIAVLTKPQWIMLLLSLLGFGVFAGLNIFLNDSTQYTLIAIFCSIVVLACGYRILVGKRKDVSIAVISLLMVFPFIEYYDSLSMIVRLIVMVLCCASCIIPIISEKFKWIRFFFWVPAFMDAGLVFFGVFTARPYIGGGVILNLLCGLITFLFMFAAVPPMIKKSASAVLPEKRKNTTIKNGSILLVTAILVSFCVPSVVNYIMANHDMEKGFYTEAFVQYERSHMVSKEEILEKKYLVATDQSVDIYQRRSLMEDLAQEDYYDAKELWQEMIKWKIDLKFCNTNKDDQVTNLGYAPQHCPYLQMGFTLQGGRNYEYITITHKIKWPGEEGEFSDWAWEYRGDGNVLSFEYTEGYRAMQTGDLVIEFYNEETGVLIDTVTIPVK